MSTAKTTRLAIRNGELQSDLDCEGYKLLNVKGIEVDEAHTAYVDWKTGDDASGSAGTALPFKTIGAALAALKVLQFQEGIESGYALVIRPGIYQFSGAQEIGVTNLLISAYGASIVSDANEETKLTVRAQGVTIEGLKIDGSVSQSGLPAGYDDDDVEHGLIEVQNVNLTLRECTFVNAAAAGVCAFQAYDGLTIDHCVFQTVQTGILGFCLGGISVTNITLSANNISFCRRSAIHLEGTTNTSTRQGIVRLVCERNIINFTNLADSGTEPAINVLNFNADLRICNNFLYNGLTGIVVCQTLRPVISQNTVSLHSGTLISLVGCQYSTITGNSLVATNAGADFGINLVDKYLVDNDAGPHLVVGNAVYGAVGASNFALSVTNQNRCLIGDNIFDGAIGIQDTVSIQFRGNTVRIPLGLSVPPFFFQAYARACNGIFISGNRFSIVPSSLNQLIEFIDLSANGISDVYIQGNSSSGGKTFTNGIVYFNGTRPDPIYFVGNTPATLTGSPTAGWINDYGNTSLQKTVIVSQFLGNDTIGMRLRADRPFKTINAAITAAQSGDVVKVIDGVFNEWISAKDGVTVRFDPTAFLINTTGSQGCVKSSATNQTFTLYHEHAPMVSSGASSTGILVSHTGATLLIHGGVTVSGGGAALSSTAAGTIKLYDGNISSTNTAAILSTVNDSTLIELRRGNISTTNNYAINFVKGTLRVFDSRIEGKGANGVVLITTDAQHIYSRCTFVSLDAGKGCIYLPTVTLPPVLQDCVLKAGNVASVAIKADTASTTVYLYGDVVANAGPEPPSNVIFDGPGSYEATDIIDGPIIEVQS